MSAPRRPLGFELALVVLVSALVLVPGIWRYSLVDPWETHYGEVAREMLENNDLVRTTWRGTMNGDPNDNEGFRSKPVLQFWMMAAGLTAAGVEDGGYSGEMTDSAKIMIAIRLPFILCAIAGLTLMWWMLARLVSRKLAWLGLLVVGSTPIFAMIARNAIPDMPMTACTIGAIALFTMAVESDDGLAPLVAWPRRRISLDARHVVMLLAGGFVLLQAAYYLVYFISAPQLALRGRVVNPAVWLPAVMAVLVLATFHRDGMLILRLPFLLFGAVIAAIKNDPMVVRARGMSVWRHTVDNSLVVWAKRSPDRYLVAALVWPFARAANGREGAWATSLGVADRVLRPAPITTARQAYMLGAYALLGVSVLAKGPPGLTVVAVVMALHVILLNKWRDLYDGKFEIVRGLLLMVVIAVPWHLAMYFKDGLRFVDEYIFTHILNRAAAGVDNSPGSFEYYTDVIGHGMWLWAALLPAALAFAFLRARTDTREGRVRFMIVLWAVVAVSVFFLVQTKFHHYILPAIPPLALLVAFLLYDLAHHRERLHPLLALLGVGIVLLLTRDLMHEPDRWIEMFVFRYDRPWPHAEPWAVDPSDGFLGLGLAAAIPLPLLSTRFTRLGVAVVCSVGVCIVVWALQVYMPHAGTHWGMRDAMRTYYEQRTVYGQKIVYWSGAQLRDDWAGVRDTWTFGTMIPDELHEGQPMTITLEVRKADDDKVTEQAITILGEVTKVGAHSVTLALRPGERAKLDPLIERGAKAREVRRRPLYLVDADRLIGWQLYWRGENFWSGGEVWGLVPEMKTQFNKTDNVEFNKYINDRTRAPLGRRYFVITEAGRLSGLKSILPTQRGQQTFEILDTTSNKFSIGSFTL